MTTPTTTINARNYSEEEFARRTDVFLAEDGAWSNLNHAKHNLLKCITPSIVESSNSHYEGLSPEQLVNLLISHNGLSGELHSGLAQVVMMRKRFDNNAENMAGMILMGANDSSQLCSAAGLADGIVNKIPHFPCNADGVPTENKRAALARCANEIEKWAEHNKETLAPDLLDKVEAELESYRSALEGVNDYLDYAQDYLNKGTKIKEAGNEREPE